jgi:hypothetical protein
MPLNHPLSSVAVPLYIGGPEPRFAVEGATPLNLHVEGGDAVARMASAFGPLASWVAGHLPAIVHSPDWMAPLAVVAGLQRAGLEPELV